MGSKCGRQKCVTSCMFGSTNTSNGLKRKQLGFNFCVVFSTGQNSTNNKCISCSVFTAQIQCKLTLQLELYWELQWVQTGSSDRFSS